MIENSILLSHYNFDRNCFSPVIDDVQRIVKRGKDGKEVITYEKVDYPSIVAANGTVEDWSLDALIKAGIDPSCPINTTFPCRLEGNSTLNDIVSAIEVSVNDNKDNVE